MFQNSQTAVPVEVQAMFAVFSASDCQVPLKGQFAFLNPWVLATMVKTAYPHYAFDQVLSRNESE